MLPGLAGPLDWNHWTCSADWVNTNIIRLFFLNKYIQGNIVHNGRDQFYQFNCISLFLQIWTDPDSILGAAADLGSPVIGNLSIPVSGPVMPSYRAIGRYWSKLDLPITSDQPIKSIFLTFVLLVVFQSLNNNYHWASLPGYRIAKSYFYHV